MKVSPPPQPVKGILALVLALSCLAPLSGREKPLRIFTSIFPLLDFARSVAGDRGEVRLLLPPGSDVHTWQPRPGDIRSLSQADLFIYIGSGLEPWADVLLKSRGRVRGRVLEAGAGLAMRDHHQAEPHEHGAETLDPHVWLDFGSDETMILRIRDALTDIDPAGTAAYRRNAAEAIQAIHALDDEFRRGLKDCLSKTIIVGGHAAFGYLAARYGLEQVSLYGLSPDAEPTPRHLIRIIELMKKKGLNSVFYEENSSRKMAEVLARETRAGLLSLNPGHNLTREQLAAGITFLEVMRRNLGNLRRGLGCE